MSAFSTVAPRTSYAMPCTVLPAPRCARGRACQKRGNAWRRQTKEGKGHAQFWPTFRGAPFLPFALGSTHMTTFQMPPRLVLGSSQMVGIWPEPLMIHLDAVLPFITWKDLQERDMRVRQRGMAARRVGGGGAGQRATIA